MLHSTELAKTLRNAILACATIGLFLLTSPGQAQPWGQLCGGTFDDTHDVGGGGGNRDYDCGNPTDFVWVPFFQQTAFNVNGQYTGQAIKTLRISLHVWGDTTVAPNYLESEGAVMVQTLYEVASLYFEDVQPPSDRVSNPNYDEAYFTTYGSDTQIRFEVEGVHFWTDPADADIWDGTCQATSIPTLRAIDQNHNPASENCINLHIIKAGCCIASDGSFAGGAATPYQAHNFDFVPSVVSCHRPGPFAGDLPFWRAHWSHEIGHILGLLHTYKYEYGSENCMSGSTDFLDDVFNPLSESTWCPPGDEPPPPPQCTVCMFNDDADCGDPYANPNDGCANNIMGNNRINSRFTSPMQIGRMHRTLMSGNAAPYAWGYNETPAQTGPLNLTWGYRTKFYQDLIVNTGCTLTLTCDLHMVPEASIIVQPGGTLIIDGGIVDVAKFATERWQGIIVQGNSSEAQDNGQGRLIMRNGGKIRNAELGVLVEGGGIIQVEEVPGQPDLFGGSFENCKIDVDMLPYTGFDPNDPTEHEANASYFDFAQFIVDPSYLVYQGSQAPITRVRLNRVDNIHFRGCVFANDILNVNTSVQRGHGITSFDAMYTLTPCGYGKLICEGLPQYPNIFRRLDHGQHATGSGPGYPFYSYGTEYLNNIMGGYAEGLTDFEVVDCQFEIGNNSAALTGQYDSYINGRHRGFFATHCFGFQIAKNYLHRASNTFALGDGIIIGYSGGHNDVVRENIASGMQIGFVGEGICSASDMFFGSFFIGLQFYCNTNIGNKWNFSSRVAAFGPNPDEHTIRLIQGTHAHLADNVMDQNEVGPPAFYDFHQNTVFGSILYVYRTGDGMEPENHSTGVLPYNLSNSSAGLCAWNGIGFLVGNGGTSTITATEVAATKLAYGNTRYLYDQLIDEGHTDEVVLEITNAWPEDLWQLRSGLLAKSPYLSTEVLKNLAEKSSVPRAIVAEICIANPDATKQDGFVKWLEYECADPLPEYMLANIEASWDTKTYRTTVEVQVADQHAVMTQTVDHLVRQLQFSNTTAARDSVGWAWQQLRTSAARYAEAAWLMDRKQFTEATAVVQAIPTEHELKEKGLDERARMLAYIDFMKELDLSGRAINELTHEERGTLQALIENADDRPALWINNLLCFHYNICRAPFTGDTPDPPQGRRRQVEAMSAPDPSSALRIYPNPAKSYVAVEYTGLTTHSALLLKDATGRVLETKALGEGLGQWVLDTRTYTAGSYTLELRSDDRILGVQKLILQ